MIIRFHAVCSRAILLSIMVLGVACGSDSKDTSEIDASSKETSRPTEQDALAYVRDELERYNFPVEIVEFKKTNGIPVSDTAYNLQFDLLVESTRGRRCAVSDQVNFVMSENGWVATKESTPFVLTSLASQRCKQK